MRRTAAERRTVFDIETIVSIAKAAVRSQEQKGRTVGTRSPTYDDRCVEQVARVPKILHSVEGEGRGQLQREQVEGEARQSRQMGACRGGRLREKVEGECRGGG